MVWLRLKDNCLGSFSATFLIFSITLFSLLIPFSFLVLAQLSYSNYLTSTNVSACPQQPNSLLCLTFQYINPTIIYALVSFITLYIAFHTLTGYKFAWLCESPAEYPASILFCTQQICLHLATEWDRASYSFGEHYTINTGKSISVGRAMFFLGLHETMLHWSRTVVEPVIETVFGDARSDDEGWAQSRAASGNNSAFWWWKLKNEVETFVLVAKSKMEQHIGLEIADFAGLRLYYLTVTIGMVRVVQCLSRFGGCLLRRRIRNKITGSGGDHPAIREIV